MQKVVIAIIILLVAWSINKIVRKIINRFIKKNEIKFEDNENIKKRVSTIMVMLRNFFPYLIYGIAIISIITKVFPLIDIEAVLVTAGVGGLAIAFASQTLVKDIITGLFIVTENQFSVGDYVKVGTIEGTVEAIEFRITKIRSLNKELHIIPNGEILQITNYTNGNRDAMIDVPIPYDVDTKVAFNVLQNVCNEINVNELDLISKPEVIGIVKFEDAYYIMRVVACTEGAGHWVTEREIRQKVLENFKQKKIVIGKTRILSA